MKKRRGIYVEPPAASRHETPQRSHEVARERTSDIIAAWHWELSSAAKFDRKPERDPIRDLAESCYLQGVYDAGCALHLVPNLILERPLARIVEYA